MPTLDVLTIQRISAADRARIEAIDPTIRLIDAGGWFDGEYRDTWPSFSANRYLVPGAVGQGTREERDEILARAEVILGGWPFPLDLRARATRLKWFHQRPAGASNLRIGDLWGSDVMVTTSRGMGSILAMAEYAIAGILHFAKALDRAVIDRATDTFDHRAYRPLLLEGKTLCVVGAGGIGREVGRLGAALGMRVIGTRRRPDRREALPPGFSVLGGTNDLERFLAESDFVAVCCQWTPETTNLINAARLAAMKRGVVLDVYVGEFDRPPPEKLWRDPRVLITPHISGASDENRHGGVDLFCENLRAYLDDSPLRNVIDWERGY